MKYRALVIGGGRIGAGFGWPDYPFTYTHAQAYAMSPRCDLVGIVEPNAERAKWCAKRWGVTVFPDTVQALQTVRPDVVSVCVPPSAQTKVTSLLFNPEVRGVWCEKPFMGIAKNLPGPVQVNYIRRADPMHQFVKQMVTGKKSHLFAWAKDEIHTRCHFEDLARWWGSDLVYMDNSAEIPGTNYYRIECGKWAMDFRHGGVEGGFMERMLDNLLDAIEGKAELLSPPYVETK